MHQVAATLEFSQLVSWSVGFVSKSLELGLSLVWIECRLQTLRVLTGIDQFRVGGGREGGRKRGGTMAGKRERGGEEKEYGRKKKMVCELRTRE